MTSLSFSQIYNTILFINHGLFFKCPKHFKGSPRSVQMKNITKTKKDTWNMSGRHVSGECRCPTSTVRHQYMTNEVCPCYIAPSHFINFKRNTIAQQNTGYVWMLNKVMFPVTILDKSYGILASCSHSSTNFVSHQQLIN